MSFSPHRYFRWLTWAEGSSLLLLLLGAMPYRALTGDRSMVTLMGSIHGVLFLMFIYTALTLAFEEKWGTKKTLLALITSSIPFGSFWFDRRYLS
ncbi:MAG: DUF3817 domain-containing protein [Bdellovibrionaceae bacterium]|nr:DUF3817 domain-containing protein [Pseudobdellovibrionaceae bacterium]